MRGRESQYREVRSSVEANRRLLPREGVGKSRRFVATIPWNMKRVRKRGRARVSKRSLSRFRHNVYRLFRCTDDGSHTAEDPVNDPTRKECFGAATHGGVGS